MNRSLFYAHSQSENEGDSEYSPFGRPWQRVKIPNLDLSDDESSGVSSSNASLENFLLGTMITLCLQYTVNITQNYII